MSAVFFGMKVRLSRQSSKFDGTMDTADRQEPDVGVARTALLKEKIAILKDQMLRKGADLVETVTVDAAPQLEALLKQRYSGARILLAEDEPKNREITLFMLEAVSMEVAEAMTAM